MFTPYTLLKFFHVLLAIVAVGANITYGVWFARASSNPDFASFALRGIKFIDDRIANPAYILLLPTGVATMYLGHYDTTTLWIRGAIVLWVVAIVLAYAWYTPTLRKQIESVEQYGPNSPQAASLALRGNVAAGIIAIIVVVILIFMIFKPR
ncbi:MAG: DUF2269 family protein [Candidatus Eremiobacteraeota bacterium]|nr:DUF2269 family protein [Candidatus Eremiobacteraeota bacterium]MBV8354389.1 DUF2269 family protein [Candidatus Eremiobacteraeota bacterium]